MYAFDGDIKVDVRELRRDVHCFNASLSEQDLESVAGQSGRAKNNLAELIDKSLRRTSYRVFSAQDLASRNGLALLAPCWACSPMTKALSSRG